MSTLSPGSVPADTYASLIAYGTHLDKIKVCSVIGPTATASCSVSVMQGGQQMLVKIQKTPPAGRYVLQFTATDTTKLLAVTPLNVLDANGQAGGTPVSSGAGPTDVVHPYTDCIRDTATDGTPATVMATSTKVLCGSSILPDSEVSDEFGFHVSQLFTAIQVRVSNKNTQYDFLLRDVVLTLPDGRIVSGRIRRFAQGVAVKGKTHDHRAIFFNSLTAAGGVYGALASFGSSAFTTAGNVFQGAFLSAFNQIFPDYTADNVNRFNNAVFDDQNPSIVPKDSIGQPPLYVVALLPKEPGMKKSISYQAAKEVRVAIEGTFIKQVSLLNLSAQSIAFKPQFISPTKVFQKPTFSFDDLRGKSDEQTFIVSNPGSTIVNIHGFKIVQGDGTASDSALSNDFEVDSDANKSTCGIIGSTTAPSTGDRAFTIAPNASCVVAVKFHPTTPGSILATLKFDGDNFEGSSSLALTGNGVGLILHATDQSSTKLPHTFGCTYKDAINCVMDLGAQTGPSASVEVYYYTGNKTDSVTFTDNKAPTSVISLGSMPTTGQPTASVTTLPVMFGQTGSTEINLTDTPATNFTTPFKITFKYQTIAVRVDIAGDANAISAKVTNVNGQSGPTPTGSVVFTFTDSTGATVTQAPVSLTNGTAQASLTGLKAGATYTVNALFNGSQLFESNSDSKVLPIPAISTNLTIGQQPATLVDGSASVSITARGAGTCSGTLAPTVKLNGNNVTVSPTSPKLTNGSGSFTFTPTTGSYAISVTFTPDNGNACAAPTTPVTATWTY